MSKALVIKGANFLANKIETITISNPIPCTGVALSKNSIAFTAIGATDTLTATVTPADTTEAITWVSSNEDVATVNDGVVTCVGVGTATITVACGEQIATCTVTSSVTLTLSEYDNSFGLVGTSLSGGKDYIAINSSTTQRTYSLTTNVLDGYVAFSDDDLPARYPYPLPHNTHSITVELSDSNLRLPFITLVNSQLTHDFAVSGGHDSAKAVSDRTAMTVGTPLDISDYTALADGFVAQLNSKVGAVTADITSTVVTMLFE